MTTCILKQDPNTQKVENKALFFMTKLKTQHAYFQGKHLFEATKQNINNS